MKRSSMSPQPRVSSGLVLGAVFLFVLVPTLVGANPLPPPGACCFPDGSCQVLDAYSCPEAGGTWMGDFTECAPNPCPQPTGPCCFPGTGQCEVMTEAECLEQWGGWMGEEWPNCEPNPCPDCKLLPCSSDACCLPDGSCVPTWPSTCEARGGTWQGLGSTCSANPCQVSSVPVEPGDPGQESRSWGQVKKQYR